MRVNNHSRGALVFLLVLCVAALGAWGCGKKKPAGGAAIPGAKGGGITVFVPCSIFAPFCEILDAYKKEHRGAKVSFDTGNSVILMRKIVDKGARPDVYISTGPKELAPLAEKGLITPREDMMPLTYDSLILVTPAGNPKKIQSVDDLAREDVKSIAISDPKINSSGMFAVDYFTRKGLWPKIASKVTFTEFGRNARNYIIQNKVDAAILYRSCLYEDLKAYDEIVAPKDIHVVEDLFKDGSMRIPTDAVVLSTSFNKEAARKFVDYMKTEKSQAIIKKWEVIKVVNK